MANRIETYNGKPALFLDEGGSYTSTAKANAADTNALVDGSYVFIDGNATWGKIYLAPAFKGSSLATREPFLLYVQAYNSAVLAEEFEFSGGAEYYVISKRLKDATEDVPFGQTTITVDRKLLPNSAGIKTRQITYDVDGVATPVLGKGISLDGTHVRRAGFANLLLKNDDLAFTSPNDFLDVNLDEVLSTDTGDGEGAYIGNFKNPAESAQHEVKLTVNNSVFARTGAESFQSGHLIDGTVLRNSIMALASLAPTKFQNFQNNGVQVNHRSGKVLYENCAFVGSEAQILTIQHFLAVKDSERSVNDELRFKNCLIGYCKEGNIYVGYKPNSATISPELAPKVVFEECYFVRMGTVGRSPWPDASGDQKGAIVNFQNSNLRIEAINCIVDTANPAVERIVVPSPTRTETGTTFQPLPGVGFFNDGFFSKGFDPFTFLHYSPAHTYQPGGTVISQERRLYRVLSQVTGSDPETDDTNFELVEQTTADNRMPDDWRMTGFYATLGIGLTQTIDVESALAKEEINITAGQTVTKTVGNLQRNKTYTLVAFSANGAVVSKQLVTTT